MKSTTHAHRTAVLLCAVLLVSCALSGCRLYQSIPGGQQSPPTTDSGGGLEDVGPDTAPDGSTNPPPLAIQLSYAGEAPIETAEVYFYDSSASCDVLRGIWDQRRTGEFDRNKLPDHEDKRTTPLGEASSGSMLEGGFEISGEFKRGDEYTVWVRGLEAPRSEGATAVEQAWGCTSAPLDPAIEVELTDHIPILRKNYRLTHSFDVSAQLPARISDWALRLSLLVKSPGSFLFGCASNYTISLDSGDFKPCTEDSIHGLVDLLTSDKSEFSDVIDELLNRVPRNTLRAAIDKYLLKEFYDRDQWIASVPHVTSDVDSLFERLQTRGALGIGHQGLPRRVDGRLEVPIDSAKMVLKEFGFYDLLADDCPSEGSYDDCPLRWFPATDLMDNSPQEEDLSAYARRGEGLFFDPAFELTVNYTSIWKAAIERVFFERYFNSSGSNTPVYDANGDKNGVPTLKEVGQVLLLECDEILEDSEISDNDPNSTTGKEKVFTAFCNDISDFLDDDLETLVYKELVVDAQKSFLRLETPDESSCPLVQPDAYFSGWQEDPLPFAEQLGSRLSPCRWTSRFGFADAEVKGSWWGEIK